MADGPGLLLDFQEVSSRFCFQFRFSVSKPKMPKLTIAERQLAKGNWLSGIPGKHVHVRSLTIGGSAMQKWMWYFVVLWYPQHDFKEVFRSKFNPVNLTNRFHMISPPKSHTLRFSPDKSHDARAEWCWRFGCNRGGVLRYVSGTLCFICNVFLPFSNFGSILDMWRVGLTAKGKHFVLTFLKVIFVEAICSSIVGQKFPSRALPLGSTLSKSGSTKHARMITLTWSSGRPQICRRCFCCSCPWVLSCSLHLSLDTLLPDSRLTGLESLSSAPFWWLNNPLHFMWKWKDLKTKFPDTSAWLVPHAARAVGSFALLAEKHPSFISGDGRALLARVGKSDVQKIQSWKSAAWIASILTIAWTDPFAQLYIMLCTVLPASSC